MKAKVKCVKVGNTDPRGVTEIVAEISLVLDLREDVMSGGETRDRAIAFSDAVCMTDNAENLGMLVVREFVKIVDGKQRRSTGAVVEEVAP